MSALALLKKRIEKLNTHVCVGLDPNLALIPEHFKDTEFPLFEFNKWVIDQTAEYAAAYKINPAFYQAGTVKGNIQFEMTVRYLQTEYPEIPTIADAKIGDTDNTNLGYVHSYMDIFGFDAITLNPYSGKESMQAFLERKNKLHILLCRTTSSGSEEIQDLKVENTGPLWLAVAKKVIEKWNSNENCAVWLSAIRPSDIEEVRKLDDEIMLCICGVLYREGNIEISVKAGQNSKGRGFFICSSRGIIFAKNPGEAAKNLRDEINKARK